MVIGGGRVIELWFTRFAFVELRGYARWMDGWVVTLGGVLSISNEIAL